MRDSKGSTCIVASIPGQNDAKALCSIGSNQKLLLGFILLMGVGLFSLTLWHVHTMVFVMSSFFTFSLSTSPGVFEHLSRPSHSPSPSAYSAFASFCPGIQATMQVLSFESLMLLVPN